MIKIYRFQSQNSSIQGDIQDLVGDSSLFFSGTYGGKIVDYSADDAYESDIIEIFSSSGYSLLEIDPSTPINSAFLNAENLGSGEGIYIDISGSTLQFRSLSGSGGVSVSSGANNTVIISSSVGGGSGEANTASNIGAGEGLFAQKDVVDLEFKSILVSGNLAVASNASEVSLSSSYATAENVGSGTGLTAGFSLGNIDLKSILVSGNLTIDSNVAEINISSSYATGENVGGAIEIFSGSTNGNLDFRTLSGSGGTSVSQVDDVIIISSSVGGGGGEANTASNLGDGEGVFAQKDGIDLQFRSISGSGTITVLSGANNTIIISGSGGSGTGISSITFPNLRALHVQDQVAAATAGGTASIGWNDRPLTTVLRNEIAGASFTSGTYGITLPSGTYIVSANAPAFKCDNHRLRLRSSTGVNFLLGPNSYSYAVENPQTHAFMHGQINVTASTTFFLQHYLQNPPGGGLAIYAFGSENSDGDVGTFADIIIYQQNTGSYTTGGSTEITASNLGEGEGFYLDTSGSTLQFRSLSGSGGISVISGANNTVLVSSSLPDVLSEVSGARSSANSLNDRISLISNFASPNAGGIIPGVYYSNGFHSLASTTMAGASNRLDLAPFFTSHALRIDEIGVQVSTQVASSLIKILIYDTGEDGWPNNKLFESGLIETSTTNWRPDTGSVDFTFQAGRQYWVGHWHSSTATLRAIALGSSVNLGRSTSTPTTATTWLSCVRRTVTWDASLDSAPNPYGGFSASYLAANVAPPMISFRATSSA